MTFYESIQLYLMDMFMEVDEYVMSARSVIES